MIMDCHYVHYRTYHGHELPMCTLFDLPWVWTFTVYIIGLNIDMDCHCVHYLYYRGHGLSLCTL